MAPGVSAAAGPPPRLIMRGIRKGFGATPAVRDVDLDVRPGQVHALVGENGAGKSTLVKVLSGALRPDAGAMTLDGRPYRPRTPLEARRRGVAMIYQELSLAPHLSVAENVLLGMEPTRWGLLRAGEVRRRALAALRELQHPELHPDTAVRQLSLPDRQLVEIARALAVGCRVLVLDEPTSSLAQQDVERLFALIGRLKRSGHAIIYISHFLDEVRRVADRVTVLRDGRVVGTGDAGELPPRKIVGMMVGREIDASYPRSDRRPGAVALEVRDLAGPFKPASASLTLRRGQVLGIAGLVGAGRTELLRCLFGLAPVRRGHVHVGVYSGYATPPRRWGASGSSAKIARTRAWPSR